MAEPLGAAVIGLGMGSNHARNYRQSQLTRLVAICDKDTAWLRYCQKEWDVPAAYTEYQDLLADSSVDIVSVALPTPLHAPVTIAALQAGKHVLCEKPMAMNVAEAVAMQQCADAACRKLMISHQYRLSPGASYLKSVVDEGTLGSIYFVNAGLRRIPGQLPSPVATGRPTGPYERNWFNELARGGGALRDLGCHMLDLALWYLGFPEITAINGAGYSAFLPEQCGKAGYKGDADDYSMIMVRTGSNTTIQVQVCFGAFIEKDEYFIELLGSNGGARLENGQVKWYSAKHGSQITSIVGSPADKPGTIQDAFACCVADDTEPFVSARHGVAVMRILQVAQEGGCVVV